MLTLTGVLKKIEPRDFVRNDGTPGHSKTYFIEPLGKIYPIKVNVSSADHNLGKVGDKVQVEIETFPYTVVDKKRKKAFLDYYIPLK